MRAPVFWIPPILLMLSVPAHGKPLISFLPKTGLAQFIVDKLELGSFPSMLGPRLMPSQHTFSGMKLKPDGSVGEKQIVFAKPDLYIRIDVLERGDFNKDGVEDLVVCWTEQAIGGGTLRDITPMLLTRYSANSPLVAIAMYAPPERTCEPDPPLSQR